MFRTSPVRHQERLQAVFADLLCGTTVRTTRHVPNLQIQLVQNAPDDGPVRSETRRANTRDE